MNSLTMTSLIVMIATVAFAAPAGAQLYRCGNTYQETPCAGGQSGKEIRGATSADGQSGGTDAACTRQGAASLKVSWAREAGATADRAYADVESNGLPGLSKDEARRVVADVYNHRGSASEIRAAVEANCMADKKLRGNTRWNPSASSSQAQPSDDERRAAEARRYDEDKAAEARRKEALCSRLNKRAEALLATQRQGQTAPAMERLRSQREATLKEARDADC